MRRVLQDLLFADPEASRVPLAGDIAQGRGVAVEEDQGVCGGDFADN